MAATELQLFHPTLAEYYQSIIATITPNELSGAHATVPGQISAPSIPNSQSTPDVGQALEAGDLTGSGYPIDKPQQDILATSGEQRNIGTNLNVTA